MSAAATTLPARIFLIGYRGSGKTSVARLLAGRLGWHWVDADALLEEHAGQTIRQIFASEGEQAFRTREAALLQELCRRDRCVIATGGGIVLRDENRQLLKATGLCVWLVADVETLWQRLTRDETTAERRPALTVGGREEIEQLLRLREPLYRACADFVFDSAGKTAEEVAVEIAHRLEVGPLRTANPGP